MRPSAPTWTRWTGRRAKNGPRRTQEVRGHEQLAGDHLAHRRARAAPRRPREVVPHRHHPDGRGRGGRDPHPGRAARPQERAEGRHRGLRTGDRADGPHRRAHLRRGRADRPLREPRRRRGRTAGRQAGSSPALPTRASRPAGPAWRAPWRSPAASSAAARRRRRPRPRRACRSVASARRSPD